MFVFCILLFILRLNFLSIRCFKLKLFIIELDIRFQFICKTFLMFLITLSIFFFFRYLFLNIFNFQRHKLLLIAPKSFLVSLHNKRL